jgi:uncharacterized alpha-E superfamily protein
MLARTADNLFWLARYMERADYVARLLQVAQRMSSLESSSQAGSEWHSTIVAAGCEEGFYAKHDKATARSVTHYLLSDLDNTSSVNSCLETGRRNARAVRTALTADMWDAVNTTWLELREFDLDNLPSDQVPRFLDWTKERTGVFNGAYANSMLRTEAFYFTRLGHFIERADNTARILDVKYHVLLPRPDAVGGVLDYYQWAAILRVVSALRAYHQIYHGRISPWNVAELLILRPELPRSLLFCFDQITRYLDQVGGANAVRRSEAHRQAGALYAQLRYGRIEDIFQNGLHEFLTDVIDRTIALGEQVSKQYLA